jgi:hypothetical protein
MSCSGSKCLIQRDTFKECNLKPEECPEYTEKIDYQMLYEDMCEHIADLVVKKLREVKS